MVNTWCERLGIEPPSLETFADRRLNTHQRLILALLERGVPTTLDDVAARFEAVGWGRVDMCRRSLARCRPASPPVYRDGDLYAIDTDVERLRWFLRDVGLIRAKVRRAAPARTPPPMPGSDVPLTPEELDVGWANRSLRSWSHRRVVLAVLDAHGGPRTREEVAALVSARTRHHAVAHGGTHFGRARVPVTVDAEGRWLLADDAEEALRSARKAVRACVAQVRARQPDPGLVAENEAAAARWNEERRAMAAERHAVLVAFPTKEPAAAAWVDVSEREVRTFVGEEELAELREGLERFDAVGAVGVHPLRSALGLESASWRALELGPPRKSRRLNRRGRTLKITLDLLMRGSCGISKPFGDPVTMASYLADGHEGKLRRRLGADAKSLYAWYAYGMLHGAVRLRWGFLDERIEAPWRRLGEPGLYDWMEQSVATGRAIEVVTGNAPGWKEPWSRAQRVRVRKVEQLLRLFTEEGVWIPREEVQAVRWVPS